MTRPAYGRTYDLPAECFIVNTAVHDGPHGRPQILHLTRGERGYAPIYSQAPNVAELVDSLNARLGVTLAQRAAMEFGSLFGFDAPGANPAKYDDDGKLSRRSA